MILHLNVNIFECFWVLHNKELVTKLSSTSCRLDIIIDAYRTGPREINFVLLQFHWFKLKSCKRSLYHGGRKEVPVSMGGGNRVYLLSGSAWMSCNSCPGWALPAQFPVLLHQTSASSSSSIPGLWYFPFPCPLLQFLNTDRITALKDAPVPKSKNNTAHTGVFFSPSPFSSIRPWACRGFSAHSSGAVAGAGWLDLPPLAGLLKETAWNPCVLVHIPLPPSFPIPAPLHVSFSSSRGSKSVLTPPVSPGFSNFPVKDLGLCTKFGRGWLCLEHKYTPFFVQRLFMCQKPLLINLYRCAGTRLCLQQKKDCQRHKVWIIHISQAGTCVWG